MQRFSNLFISVRRSTCFRRLFRPSSGAQNCIYSVKIFVRPILLPAVGPNVSQFIDFCNTLYMFQTVFPSIIRSSKLDIQRQVFVRPILPAVGASVSQFIVFCKTLYMFQTVFPSIIRSSKLHIQRQEAVLL